MKRYWLAFLFGSIALSAPAWSQDVPILMPQLSHNSGARFAIITDDGKRVLSAGLSDIRIWSVATGQIMKVIPLPPNSDVLAIRGDGRQAVFGKEDTAALWDLTTGKKLHQFDGFVGEVVSAAFSKDNALLAIGTRGRDVIVFDVANGKKVQSFNNPTIFSHALQFTSDNSQLLAACGSTFIGASFDANGCVIQWSLDTGKEVRRLKGHKGSVIHASLSADGKALSTVGYDSSVKLWNFETGKEIRTFRPEKEDILNAVGDTVISSDGKFLIYVYGDAVQWMADGKKEARIFDGGGPGRADAVYLSKDDKHLVTVSNANIRLFDVNSGKVVRAFGGRGIASNAMAISADGKRLAIGSWELYAKGDQSARVFDLAAGKQLHSLKHQSEVRALAMSDDGNWLITGANNARLWDMTNGKEAGSFNAHVYDHKSILISPDGKMLLSADLDRNVQFWDLPAGKMPKRFGRYEELLYAFAVSRDGSRVVSADSNDKIRVWDLKTQKSVGEYKTPEKLTTLAISPDAKWLAVCERGNKTVRLLETDNGKLVRSLEVPIEDGNLETMVFSEDKKYLAGGGYGNVVVLWDLAGKNPARQFPGHDGTISAIKFLPQAKILVSTSHDCTTRFWDTASGKELCRLLAFDDGSWLVMDGESRFDSNGDAKSTVAHWILRDEAHPLGRFRELFQDEGLLAKHLGHSKSPLREVKLK